MFHLYSHIQNVTLTHNISQYQALYSSLWDIQSKSCPRASPDLCISLYIPCNNLMQSNIFGIHTATDFTALMSFLLSKLRRILSHELI